jgi:hypothetical protein
MCHANEHWTKALPLALHGIRTVFKVAVQASSAELVYREPLRIPGELLNAIAHPVEPAHLITQLRQHILNYKPALSSERALQNNKPATV